MNSGDGGGEGGLQLAAQGAESPAEYATQRAIRETERLLDRCIVHVFEISQCQGGAVQLREPLHRGLKVLFALLLVRGRRCAGLLLFWDRFLRHYQWSFFADDVARPESRDRSKPGRKFLGIAHA